MAAKVRIFSEGGIRVEVFTNLFVLKKKKREVLAVREITRIFRLLILEIITSYEENYYCAFERCHDSHLVQGGRR